MSLLRTLAWCVWAVEAAIVARVVAHIAVWGCIGAELTRCTFESAFI